MNKLQENKLREYIRQVIKQETLIPKTVELSPYQKLFKKCLEKYGVSSPNELSDEKKKEFFNWVDSQYNSEQEINLNEGIKFDLDDVFVVKNSSAPYTIEDFKDDIKNRKLNTFEKFKSHVINHIINLGFQGNVRNYNKLKELYDYLINHLEETSSVNAMAGGDSYQTPFAFSKPGSDQKKKRALQGNKDWDVIDVLEENISGDLINLLDKLDKKVDKMHHKKANGFRQILGQYDVWTKDDVRNLSDEEKQNLFILIKDFAKKNNISESKLEKFDINRVEKGDTIIDSNDEKFKVLRVDNKGFFVKDLHLPQDKFYITKKQAAENGRYIVRESIDFKNTEITPKRIIANAIKSIREQLNEVERLVDKSRVFKEENNIKTSDFYKRSNNAIRKIGEQITRIANKMQQIK